MAKALIQAETTKIPKLGVVFKKPDNDDSVPLEIDRVKGKGAIALSTKQSLRHLKSGSVLLSLSVSDSDPTRTGNSTSAESDTAPAPALADRVAQRNVEVLRQNLKDTIQALSVSCTHSQHFCDVHLLEICLCRHRHLQNAVFFGPGVLGCNR